MRFKYYKLTLRQMKFKKAFVFFLFIAIITYFCIYFLNKKLEPTLEIVCKSSSKGIAFKASYDAVKECMEGVTYDDLIKIEKNNDNKVTMLNANVEKINNLVNNISIKIRENIEKNDNTKVKLPLSELVGIKLIGASAPKIKVKTLIDGSVEVNFKSTLEEAGINQTKHTLYVEIQTGIETIAPLYTNYNTYKNDILIAQTVIISDIPNSYYNVNGIDDIKQINEENN